MIEGEREGMTKRKDDKKTERQRSHKKESLLLKLSFE